jgi:hypothetical protein
MHTIDTAWQATIAGYVGTPFVQQVATPLACAPIQGVRVAYQIDSPTPCDDFYVANCDPKAAVAAIKSVPPIANQYITVLDDRPDCVARYTALGLCHTCSEVLMALMQHILNQDTRAGIQLSTLLATQSAVPLYQRVGYQALAQTHVFTP